MASTKKSNAVNKKPFTRSGAKDYKLFQSETARGLSAVASKTRDKGRAANLNFAAGRARINAGRGQGFG